MVAGRVTLDPTGNWTGFDQDGDGHDTWNHLVEVRDGENVIAAHEYGGLNRRTVEAPTYGNTYYLHKFYNSSWQMLEMRSATTQNAQPESLGVSFQYVWSARYVDAPVLREYAGTRYYFLGDANFNVTTLLDTSGDAREHYHYDPYGKVTILNGGMPDTDGDQWTADPNNISDVYNQIVYTGRRYDHETGLHYYRNRYYHAELGRFVSRDPIAYRSGYHLYGYARQQPTGATDPTGMWPWIPPDTHQKCIDEVDGTYNSCWKRAVGVCLIFARLKAGGALKKNPRCNKLFLTCMLVYKPGCAVDRSIGYKWCDLWFN